MKWNKNNKIPTGNNLCSVGIHIVWLFFVSEDKQLLNDKVGDKEKYLNRNIGDDIMDAEHFVQKCHQCHFGKDNATCQDNIANEGGCFVGVGLKDEDAVDKIVDG